jgi:hypothetical protein
VIEGKGLGDKKVNRVGMSLSNHYLGNLKKLSKSCEMRPTSLTGLIVEMCLDDPVFVEKLQNEFNKYTAYRVRLVKNYKTGRIDYVLYNDNERNDYL